jgi:hypothetical protein
MARLTLFLSLLASTFTAYPDRIEIKILTPESLQKEFATPGIFN